MRFDGTLSRWNDERGFGFITPALGGEDIFVHMSAFPRDGSAPRLHEPLSFEVELNREGRKRATMVRRPEPRRPAPLRTARTPGRSPARSVAARAIVVALAVALGTFAFHQYSKGSNSGSTTAVLEGVAMQVEGSHPASFSCDGRIHCSQMSSCAEARYFLANCPGTKMDGDGDGVPCEQQWCRTGY